MKPVYSVYLEKRTPKNNTVIDYFRDKKFIFRNLAVWLAIYLLFMATQFSNGQPDYTGLLEVSISFAVAVLLFYTHFYLCAVYFHKKRGLYFLLLFALLLAFYAAVYFFLMRDEKLPANRVAGQRSFATYLYLTLYFALLVLLSGFYWSVLFAGKKIRENTEMQLQLQKIQTEKLFAEKQFLQSQINPHFLYNTLNFFYARSLASAPDLADGIMTLSSIMKYSLQKNENENGLVRLEEEVTHIRNVLHIHQLRYSGKLQVNFSATGNAAGVLILPLVLITLVENVLKHGDLNDALKPAFISLQCNEAENKISFTTENKKRNGPKEDSTGIGISNTTKRIQWVYGDNYSFEVKNENTIFAVSLTLPIYREKENMNMKKTIAS